MPEVYDDDNCIIDFPRVTGVDLDQRRLVQLFSSRSQGYCTTSINKYLFSYKLNWVSIVPSGSLYRVIGRFLSIKNLKYIKRCVEFDVFYRGELGMCDKVYRGLIRQCLESVDNELC